MCSSAGAAKTGAQHSTCLTRLDNPQPSMRNRSKGIRCCKSIETLGLCPLPAGELRDRRKHRLLPAIRRSLAVEHVKGFQAYLRLHPTYAQEVDISLMDEYKGRTVKKMFQGRYFMGQVTRVRVFKKDPPLYHIKYEDGDAEDVEERELRHILVIGDGGCVTTRSASQSQPSSSPAAARGRKRGAPQEAPASPPKQAPKRVAKTRTLAAIAEPAAANPQLPDIARAHPTSGDRGVSTPRFSHRVCYGPHVFIAGQTVQNADAPGMQSYTGQTKKVLSMLEAQLTAAGSSKHHMLKVNVILRNIDEGRDEYNAAWEEWVDDKAMPVRTTIEGKLMAPDLLVEVDAIAVRKDACA